MEYGASGVEVAVEFLGGGDFGDEFVEVAVEFGVGVGGEGIGSALDDLEDVGIVEGGAAKFAGHEPGGFGEVFNAAGFFAFLEVIPNRGDAIGFEARQPESVGDVHGGERDWLERVVWGSRGEEG